jgi:hypothetical protein
LVLYEWGPGLVLVVVVGEREDVEEVVEVLLSEEGSVEGY